MEAHLLLADFAQGDGTGKVSAIGLGWSVTTSPTPHHSLVVVLKVGWEEANNPHHMSLDLLTADGLHAVQVPSPVGAQPLRVEVDFEVGRPPGTPIGSSVDHSLAINVGPGLPLSAGRYEWRMEIDGVQRGEWRAGFTVRATL